MRIFLLTITILLALVIPALAKDGFTQEDRERLIRLETTLKVFMEQTNKRFEDMNERFEDMNKRFEELRQDMNNRFEMVNKRFEELREDMNKRFEMIDKRFDQLYTFLWIITGIFTTLTLGVIGFAYWDRRTIIRKAKEETIEHLEREGKLKNLLEALRELARKDEKLAKVLKEFGLL